MSRVGTGDRTPGDCESGSGCDRVAGKTTGGAFSVTGGSCSFPDGFGRNLCTSASGGAGGRADSIERITASAITPGGSARLVIDVAACSGKNSGAASSGGPASFPKSASNPDQLVVCSGPTLGSTSITPRPAAAHRPLSVVASQVLTGSVVPKLVTTASHAGEDPMRERGISWCFSETGPSPRQSVAGLEDRTGMALPAGNPARTKLPISWGFAIGFQIASFPSTTAWTRS
jgi:hypothetical protein